jgi:two-component system, chemotaxis family, chemotaxis protein CheY
MMPKKHQKKLKKRRRPLDRSSSDRSSPKQIREAASARLLVVEDDPDLGEVLCEVLRMSSHHVSYAADGLAALEILRDGDLPHPILLDLMLPRMNGWEFRSAQLLEQRLRNIPVVVLSAMGETVQPIEADHLLRKPVDCEKLISVIERFRRRTPT